MIVLPLCGPFVPVESRVRDTLLITSLSFERRCLGFSSYLHDQTPRYRCDEVLLLTYDDRGDSAIRRRMARHADELRLLATRIAGRGELLQQSLDPYNIRGSFEFFRELFTSLPKNSSVVVDISTLTKISLLYLLKAARESFRVANMRLVYTRANYGRSDMMSWGAEEPIILPGFGQPRPRHQKKTKLVLFCGLEPDRSYSVWRRFGQNECLSVYVGGTPTDIDQCALRAKQAHRFARIASQVEIPPFDPKAVVELLTREIARCRSESSHLFVAPLTTKWEVVGTWSFFQGADDDLPACLTYAAPGRLNAAGRTLENYGECVMSRVW